MATLVINGEAAIAEDGARLLDFLHTRGIEVPTMCYDGQLGHFSSCMICAVKETNSGKMIPACAARISKGMQIETDSDEVRDFRRVCLELLLSEHLGDCEGPCRIGCPAQMNIPRMIRQIRSGDMAAAAVTVKAHIALPAILGRICTAPCEKVCRRGQAEGLGLTSRQVNKLTSPDSETPNPVDPVIASKTPSQESFFVRTPSDTSGVPPGREQSSLLSKQSLPVSPVDPVDPVKNSLSAPVSICLLKRHVADTDLAQDTPYKPEIESIDKKVAVIGAGPAGLSAAYYLACLGCKVTVHDKGDAPGGTLREVSTEELPAKVLKAEIKQLKSMGIAFKLKKKATLKKTRRGCDVLVLATGNDAPAPADLPDGVFAAGSCVKRMKMAIRACADGRRAAFDAYAYLTGEAHPNAGRRFNSRMGKLPEDALKVFAQRADSADRVTASDDDYSSDEAVRECGRCFDCDCRKADACRLRDYADAYGAKAARFKGDRGDTVRMIGNDAVIFEPGKCIRCGLCVRTTAAAEEEFGLSFKGRGFGTVIAVPFDEPMDKALQKTAERCIQSCPTGALAHPLDRGLQVDKLLGVPARGLTSSQEGAPEGGPE